MPTEDKTTEKASEKGLDDLKAELEALRKENETLKSKGKEEAPPPKKTEDKAGEEDDLITKAQRGKQSDESRRSESRSIEEAIKFTMTLSDFMRSNQDILPAEIGQIIQVADKEKYESSVEKSNALKSAFVQSFFSVQANVDLLTQSQQAQLKDYLSLTKGAKEGKASQAYENLFEPALEMIKRVRKAEELGRARNGYASASSMENAYRDKLVKLARQTHLGEKGDSA